MTKKPKKVKRPAFGANRKAASVAKPEAPPAKPAAKGKAKAAAVVKPAAAPTQAAPVMATKEIERRFGKPPVKTANGRRT